MVIYVDIDGTICSQEDDYSLAKPNYNRINKINKLYAAGHEIIYWTARGTVTGKRWFDITIKQLNKWGAKYHELRMGKPFYDLVICDKSKRIEELQYEELV